MAESRILRFDEQPWHDRGTGIQTRVLVSRRIGAENLTNGVTRFPPGSKIALHWHNCAESVMVIEGEAICEINGVRQPMAQYDITYVPANVPHRFLNQSDRPMAIMWTYAASHVTRTFADTGVTVEHLSDNDTATAPSG